MVIHSFSVLFEITRGECVSRTGGIHRDVVILSVIKDSSLPLSVHWDFSYPTLLSFILHLPFIFHFIFTSFHFHFSFMSNSLEAAAAAASGDVVKIENLLTSSSSGSAAGTSSSHDTAAGDAAPAPPPAAAPHPHAIPAPKNNFWESTDEPPKLKWRIWYQLFEDHLLVQGISDIADNRKLALLRTSLGAEGYRICSELCVPPITYAETVRRLADRFAPHASQIYDRAQFNMRNQKHGESSLQYVTILRSLAATYGYPKLIRDFLIRDRFVAG